MPRPKILGSSLGPTDVGDRLVPSVPATKAATPPIEWRKFCVNGSAPSAQLANTLHEATNAAAVYRPKQLFSQLAAIQNGGVVIPTSSGTAARSRWRFAFRTGPYTTRVMCAAVLTAPSSGGDYPSSAKLTIYSDDNEAVSVGSATFYYGPAAHSTVSGWQYLKTIMQTIIGLSANTDYYARFDDVDYGRLVTANVFELPSLTDGIDGYLPQSLSADSEIVATYRQNTAAVQTSLWKGCGGTLLSWSKETTHSTIASATATNLIDGSSTTVTSTTPGFVFDTRGMARLSQTAGVPIRMQVAAYTGDAGGKGVVELKDSSGAVVCSLSGSWFTGSTRWRTVTATLPESVAKYDLHFNNGGGAHTFYVYAVCIYPYEA